MIGEYQDAEYFLTDNLRMINNKMEYRTNENSNFKPVLKRNWHILLEEYGWGKITKQWITQLNKLSPCKEKNSLYGVFDCESDGNCFFHCIAHALNEKYLGTELYYNSDDIRKMISDNLTEEQYDTIINYYRIMKDANDFDENWDPYSIHSIEEFKEKINISGHEYWGDWILLQVLINSLQMNIFILNSNSIENNYSVYNTLNDYNPNYGTIFLLYEDTCHFKLIGNFNGSKMISYFENNTLPIELRKLYHLN